MSVTFTKLFSSITASTVWSEPDRVRICWITMLAMADAKGRIWASLPGLAHMARVPLEDAADAVRRFLAPDPHSRTKEHEGRRIEEIDGGWKLLNHEKYRAIRDEEARKEQQAEWVRNKRASEKAAESGKVSTGVDNVDRSRPNAEAEAEAYAEAEKRNPKVKPPSAARRAPAAKKTDGQPSTPGSAIWEAYAAAFQRRYNSQPVRNQEANRHMKQVAEKLGAEEGALVAAFYLTHNRGLYVSSTHATALLVRDAAALRTQWATNRQTTDTGSRQVDRTSANGAAFGPLIADAQRREGGRNES